MSAAVPSTCPVCGSVAVAESVGGQCPSCLLRVATVEEESASASWFNPTQRQFGEYVLGRQIGAGGMGAVYEARRISDDRKVAIKLIRDAHVASPATLCRFAIEAEAAARLEHPNIVAIHEVGECDGHPYFSMDFVEGESLNAKIARGEFAFANGDAAASQRDIAQLLAKIARAVHHAHLRGVLHRDLKPANILIDAEGEPHLTDFGLAKILQPRSEDEAGVQLTTSGDLPGTPSFMSPEQISGGEVGYAADIYGLGAVLYALLAGRPPFHGATSIDVFKQIAEHSPARLRSINPSVHSDLERICFKCLEKDSGQRYSSAEALANDLENFVNGRPVKARAPSALHRMRHWVRRNPVGTALIASLVLGLSASVVLLKIVNDQRREIELDRDQTFDEGMQKTSQIWRDPATKAVTISGRELAILAGRSPAEARGAQHQLTFGVSANDSPASLAQRYARLLLNLQHQMGRELGEKVVFDLRLLKRFNPNEQTLARGEVDFVVLSAVDFLEAERLAPGIMPLAHSSSAKEVVIFANRKSKIEALADLRGKSIAFPDRSHSATAWAKARLLAAGLRARDLRFCTNLVDRGPETGDAVVSTTETVERVLRGEVDAGITTRNHFERYRHLGLVALDQFAETPNVLAARQSLDPKFSQGLQRVMTSEGHKWPESKFVADETRAVVEPLRKAMTQAQSFDSATTR